MAAAKETATQWETVVGEFGEVKDPREEIVIGTYQGSRFVEMVVDGDERTVTAHDFLDDEGDPFTVWGSKDLESKLTDDIKGRLVRIEFVEKVDIGNGRTFTKFKVQVAKA